MKLCFLAHWSLVHTLLSPITCGLHASKVCDAFAFVWYPTQNTCQNCKLLVAVQVAWEIGPKTGLDNNFLISDNWQSLLWALIGYELVSSQQGLLCCDDYNKSGIQQVQME